MPVYDGNKLAQDHLLEIAKLCAQAVLKAPQLTGRVRPKMLILTGRAEIEPVIDALMALGRVDLYNAVSHMSWSYALHDDKLPVLLLIGAEGLNRSELNWNCGACGFPTCGDFNRYSKEREAEPLPPFRIQGPTCAWKIMDYGAACDWACATAWQANVTNRIEIASGMAARSVGYLEECTVVHGLPLGPCEDMYWYSRPVFEHALPYDLWANHCIRDFPHHFAIFGGSGIPQVKTQMRWWEDVKHKALVDIDPEERRRTMADVSAELRKIRAKVRGEA